MQINSINYLYTNKGSEAQLKQTLITIVVFCLSFYVHNINRRGKSDIGSMKLTLITFLTFFNIDSMVFTCLAISKICLE